jgi:hypothetical protein
MKLVLTIPDGEYCRGCRFLMPHEKNQPPKREMRTCGIFGGTINTNEDKTEFLKYSFCLDSNE